jgi:hypothetical protein
MDTLTILAFLATAILAAVGLGPSPNFPGLVGLLVMIQLYPRTSSRKFLRLVQPWAASTIGTFISDTGPALNALQSSAISVVVLICASAIMPAISTSVVWFDANYIGKNHRFSWFRLAAFPAFWASSWGVLSLASPVGRLLMWSPVTGLGPYAWVSSYLGTWGIDFIVAGWSVLLTEVIAVPLFQRALANEDPEDPRDAANFAPFTDNPDEPRSNDHSTSRHLYAFALLLLTLSLPSLWTDVIPNPTYTPATTPFTLGCAIPQTHLPNMKPHSPTLQDYIDETKKMTNAKVVLWPESALRFDKEEERNATFQKIAKDVLIGHKGLHVGLGFEEYANKSHKGRASKRNGFALLVEDKVVLQYYKRLLVPSMQVSRSKLGFKLTSIF